MIEDWTGVIIGLVTVIVIIACIYRLGWWVFRPIRQRRRQQSLERAEKQQLEREAFLESTDEVHLLLSIYETQKELHAELRKQTRNLNTISIAVQIWLALTVIGLIAGCLIVLFVWLDIDKTKEMTDFATVGIADLHYLGILV